MAYQSQPNEEPSVTGPPDGVPPAPPVRTRAQCLPFGELTWENFERLCHRLVAREGDVQHCERYGRAGEAQAGIDIYARQDNGRYHCLQAKRHQRFGAAEVIEAVDLFLGGDWAQRAERFTIAVQASLRSTSVQEEIERQAAILELRGVCFIALDGEALTNQLRTYPALVDDFFGRPWVQALLGEDAAAQLANRLDGAAFARARAQLTRVYETQFHFFDPGSFASIAQDGGRPALTLLERFLVPDILVREAPDPLERMHGRERAVISDDSGLLQSLEAPEGRPINASSATSRMRRTPLHDWIGDAQRLVVLGDAGCGKSTLLRVIALDLLHDQAHFKHLASRWGTHLPVLIPFARWSAQAAQAGGAVGIKDIVRRSLDPLLTGSLADLIDQAIDDGRVLLLVDGLDEWSNEQAARTTLAVLVATVDAHCIPLIVSGRPKGLDKIGALPADWKRGTVAPLSVAQQGSIASRWFARFSSEQVDAAGTSDAGLRTKRFMAELVRDGNLAALATTPLLLIGLVTLALRGQFLPRTRSAVYDQLVRILLEVHPTSRATAAGDTEPRFRYAADAERRAAIARLAFAIREQAGGANVAHASARATLQEFLASASGFALDSASAAKAAAEILAVNAETQGLIVEKGPGEVGFVHASFAEYLGAEHIGGWPFEEIVAFVRARAGEARWRNVIANLLGYLQRRDEIDRLVAVIEEPCSDELSQLNRQALLGDIAFGVSARAPATARRLALATMQRVESEDWLPARREALGSVLKGLSDPTLKAEVEKRLARWLPARVSWRVSLIAALGDWQATPELEDTLFRAMHDEDQQARRAAAMTYARVFSPSEPARRRLVEGLARSRDLPASAALLESLARGWSTAPSAISLFHLAHGAQRGDIRLVGALGLAIRGARSGEMRDLALTAQKYWSGVSRAYQAVAAEMLATYWPDQPDLIRGAVERLSGYGGTPWEYVPAVQYLLACDITNAAVRRWVLRAFDSEYPFHFPAAYDHGWKQIGRLASIDHEIRVAATKYWQDPKHRLLEMRGLVGYVTYAADPEVLAVLRDVVADIGQGIDRMWALKALLAGWGREHPDTRLTLDAVIAAPDEELDDLVSMLPAVYADRGAARKRLLRIGLRPNVRWDLLAEGLAECGCNGSDDEAVKTILDKMKQSGGGCEWSRRLFRSFGAHPAVRTIAAQNLHTGNNALAAIAAAYANDPEFSQALLDAAIPLPTELRTHIVEFAAEGASGTALEGVLSQGMLETDLELRVRMVIAHYARLPLDARERAEPGLLEAAVAVGPDTSSTRIAALAGLTAIGALGELAELRIRGQPVRIAMGREFNPVRSLERQVCERFADFEAAFGAGLPDRVGSVGHDTRLAEVLSAAPGASPASRSAFLRLAERSELPRTVQAVRALAAELPRSALLLQHCFAVLEKKEGDNSSATVNGEVGVVLSAHFPENAEVQRRLVTLYEQSPSAKTAITLAVYSPHAAELLLPTAPDLGRQFGDWTMAVHISARRADSDKFAALLEAMLTRQLRTEFDAQEITNLAVHDRLQRDPELRRLLSAQLRREIHPSISGSFARYLAAAGQLETSARAEVAELLRVITAEQSLPLAGYDAIADEWRCTRATLLDALSAGLELT